MEAELLPDYCVVVLVLVGTGCIVMVAEALSVVPVTKAVI